MIAQLHGHVTVEVTQNYGTPHKKELINYGLIKIMDLQHHKIIQYT